MNFEEALQILEKDFERNMDSDIYLVSIFEKTGAERDTKKIEKRMQERSMAFSAIRSFINASNQPLTLEELRNLEIGDPLWISGIRTSGDYMLLVSNSGGKYKFVDIFEEIAEAKEIDYGVEWMAYRRKLEVVL